MPPSFRRTAGSISRKENRVDPQRKYAKLIRKARRSEHKADLARRAGDADRAAQSELKAVQRMRKAEYVRRLAIWRGSWDSSTNASSPS